MQSDGLCRERGWGPLESEDGLRSSQGRKHWAGFGEDKACSLWSHSLRLDCWALMPHVSAGKESAYNAGGRCSIPGSGRSPGEVNDNPVQYPCLENPMDRGAWRAAVHVCVLSHVQLCDPMNCSLPRSSVHGILQARILDWAAMPSSRGSSPPRD